MIVVRPGPVFSYVIYFFLFDSTMVEAHLVDKKATFASFSHILGPRILCALADAGFARPTLAIPLALENRDILARARTGSGKTAAYCIPVVQKILNAKSVGDFLPLDIWISWVEFVARR
jgi:superfamily II DNA/RNA helicase